MNDLVPSIPTPSTFREVIDLWPSPDDLASELEVGRWTVPKWRTRNNIPAEWWHRLLSTERARNSGITAELLAKLAARDSEEVRA